MELELIPLSKWQYNNNFNIALSGPTSPMIGAQDFVKKIAPTDNLVLTNLYRIQGKDETTFTTWEGADLEPVQAEVICGVLNFLHIFVFADVGSKYVPICLWLDGEEPNFNKSFEEYNWLSSPSKEDIVEVISKINLPILKDQFDSFCWKVKDTQADEWFAELTVPRQMAILQVDTPEDAVSKWFGKTPKEKYELFKEWKE